MKKRNIALIIFGILTLAVETVIFVLSACSGDISSAQSSGFTQWLLDIVGKINPNAYYVIHPEEFKPIARKLFGHFLLFGGLGFFSMLTLSCLENAYRDKKMQIILSCLTFGLSSAIYSEVIQLFTSDRAGQFKDVLIDFGGFILFSLAIFLILFIINKHKEKKNVSTLG